jgi:hypothetical protein
MYATDGSYDYAEVDVATSASGNTATITFAVAPAVNAYRVVITG